MAAAKNVSDVKLQVRFENGTTASGKAKIQTASISDIKLDPTYQQLYDSGSAYAGLTNLTLESIRRVEVSDLTEV